MEITANNYRTYYQNLINQRASFEIYQVSLTDMISICAELEEYIEKQNLKCRIYTEKRMTSLLSSVLNKRYGILSAAFILAHNLLTWSPDYEISRDLANNRINVKYKK